ncbi:MAG: hypothetical protein R3F21_10340 [Myxococcota bacterium]
MPALNHFWWLAILATVLNGGIWWIRGRSARAVNPELTSGYVRLILGFSFWANIPWVVMGIGVHFGGAESMNELFDPLAGGPFVVAWHLSVISTWCAGTYWLFLQNGAEKLAEHPGLLRMQFNDPGYIKGIWIVSVLGGIVALAALLLGHNR